MEEHDAVGRLNVATAAVLAQLLIVVILYVGASIVRVQSGRRRFAETDKDPSSFAWWILILAVMSLGVLLLSDELANLWKPAFNQPLFTGVPFSSALAAAFALNIACISLLVARTRGSRLSEFSPAFFLLPPLAIFLREPLFRVVAYTAAIVVAFTITLPAPREDHRPAYAAETPLAFWWVSVSCMAVAVFIGFATRPR